MSRTQHPPTDEGPWAVLPVNIWRHVALTGQAMAWPDSIRLFSMMATVNRAMREAVIGPGSEALWDRPHFTAGASAFCGPGLSRQQAQSLNRLQAQHCRTLSRLHMLVVQSGGWSPADLREVCTSLPRQIDHVFVKALHDSDEAEIIGAALAGRSVQHAMVVGSAPVVLPCTLQHLELAEQRLGSSNFLEVFSAAAQARSRQRFHQLLPLAALREAEVTSLWLVLTGQDVGLIERNLRSLRKLRLVLHCWPTPDGTNQQALDSLGLLVAAGVQLSLELYVWHSISTQAVLEQVHGLPLQELRITFAGPAGELSPADEALLAACCKCERLVLCFKDQAKRLRVSPQGVRVEYGHFPTLPG